MIFMKIGVGRACLLFVLFLTVPHVASAQVVINEVMYNPKGNDTGREWIELYNTGSSDVTMVVGSGKGSWRIGDSSNHTLIDPAGGIGRGSLIIPAGGYTILANDPTELISGEYAGGSYSVIKSSISLNNTGLTVSLVDGNGVVADSFSYTKDMGGNDDGTSLQKSGSSWLAALPTPGVSNAADSYVPPVTDASTTQATNDTIPAQSNAAPAPVSSYVPPPVPQLFADAGGDRTVIVGADTQFNGRAYNRQKENVEHVRFLWNFGDGSTADGPTVVHHYEYPGRYAAMLTIAENLDAVSDRIIVTAEPAKLAFDVPSDGSVAIKNYAGRDLDLSGWIVRSSGQMFTLPEHSVILNGETMRIPQKTLKFWSGAQTELDYPNGVIVLHANESSGASVSTPVPVPSPAASVAPAPRTRVAPAADPIPEADVSTETAADTTSTGSSEAQTAAAAAAVSSNSMYWWLGALALSALAGGAVLAVRRIRAGEWDIVEET